MKNKLAVLFCLGVFAVGIVACGGRKDMRKRGVAVFSPLSETVKIEDLDQYVESVEAIPLEATDSLLFYIRQVLITPSGQFVVQGLKDVFVFGKDGKRLFQVGKRGNGVGEYSGIFNICLSEDGKSVLVQCVDKKILVYSLADGHLVKTIKLTLSSWYIPYAGIAPSVNGGFFLAYSNPPDYSYIDQPFYCLREFDSTGAVVRQLLPWEDHVVGMDMITQAHDNSYILRPRSGDNICYRIQNGQVDSMLRIDFGEMNIPYMYLGWGKRDVRKYIRSPYFKKPTNFQETKQHICFSCIGPDTLSHYFVINKKTSKGIHWVQKGKDFVFLVIIRAADKDSFYAAFYEYEDLSPTSPIPDPFERFLIKEKGIRNFEKNANPMLVKIRFKV